jgi:hypothetical protein
MVDTLNQAAGSFQSDPSVLCTCTCGPLIALKQSCAAALPFATDAGTRCGL